MPIDFTLAWDAHCGTGESCTWDEAHQRVLFCDIPAGRIYALGTRDDSRTMWTLPEVVGSFGLCRSGKLIVALRHRIVLFNPANGIVTDFAGPIEEPAGNRLNDGKVGPDGCFWVGGMDESAAKQPTASLYRVTPDGRVEKKAEGYTTANGLAWSPDGRTMYHSDSRVGHADSPTGRIDAWDFDPATGAIANRRTLATLSNEEGRPDGGATDAEGFYWSCGVSAGCLNRFAPDGRLVEKHPFPVGHPTMPCFAGGQLYVTSLGGKGDDHALHEPSHDGGLFRAPAPVQGCPVTLFADA